MIVPQIRVDFRLMKNKFAILMRLPQATCSGAAAMCKRGTCCGGIDVAAESSVMSASA
jgi:hypothetical protein